MGMAAVCRARRPDPDPSVTTGRDSCPGPARHKPARRRILSGRTRGRSPRVTITECGSGAPFCAVSAALRGCRGLRGAPHAVPVVRASLGAVFPEYGGVRSSRGEAGSTQTRTTMRTQAERRRQICRSARQLTAPSRSRPPLGHRGILTSSGREDLVEQGLGLVLVGVLREGEFAHQDLARLASIRFSPADRPRSRSRRHRSRTTSATLITSPEASFSRFAL